MEEVAPTEEKKEEEAEEVELRIWMGEQPTSVSHWWWDGGFLEGWRLCDGNRGLRMQEVFVPGHCDKPTIDPRDMESIKVCKKVDW